MGNTHSKTFSSPANSNPQASHPVCKVIIDCSAQSIDVFHLKNKIKWLERRTEQLEIEVHSWRYDTWVKPVDLATVDKVNALKERVLVLEKELKDENAHNRAVLDRDASEVQHNTMKPKSDYGFEVVHSKVSS